MSLLNQWIEALESGKYRPCIGKYREGDNFCTVGVLLDLSNPHLWDYTDYGNWHYPVAGISVIAEEVPEVYEARVVCQDQSEWDTSFHSEDLRETIQDLNDEYGSYDKALDMLKALRNGWDLSVGEELITTREMEAV